MLATTQVECARKISSYLGVTGIHLSIHEKEVKGIRIVTTKDIALGVKEREEYESFDDFAHFHDVAFLSEGSDADGMLYGDTRHFAQILQHAFLEVTYDSLSNGGWKTAKWQFLHHHHLVLLSEQLHSQILQMAPRS